MAIGQDGQAATPPPGAAAAGDSVLRRKAQAGQAEHQARAMSVPKALRLTAAKAADDLFDMALAVIGIRLEDRAGDTLEELFAEPGLMMLLDGPERRRGAAFFDPALVGGLIQQQTMGQVLADPGGVPRRMTPTDAAICAPFLDALLERAAALPEAPEERALLAGYRFGSQAPDARLVLMALEAPAYRVAQLTVDLAQGVRQGRITLCLPAVEEPGRRAAPGPEGADEASRAPGALEPGVMTLRAELKVALARVSLPLSGLGRLAPGDTLALPGARFDAAMVLTADGRRIAQGTLGQIDGMRALRLAREAEAGSTPQRRAGDRAVPELDPLGGNVASEGAAGLPGPGGGDGLTSLSGLPDVPNLPNLPDLPDLPELTDLPELPDMSDLPGLDGDEDALPPLPQQGVG
jgi:flagellar motor switch protein FliM